MKLVGPRRTRGLTLIETIIALTILAMLAMTLSIMIAASQRLTDEGREKSIASQAIRSYIETKRTLTRAQFMVDTQTPADFLPSATTLKNATGEVFKVNTENSSNARKVAGARGAGVMTVTDAGLGADTTTLGMPRDLSGNGNATENLATSTTSLLTIPTRIKLTWQPYAGKPNQTTSMVVYASFTLR